MQQITVQDIFCVSYPFAKFKIVRNHDEVWKGTLLDKCPYRDNYVKRILPADGGGFLLHIVGKKAPRKHRIIWEE